MFECLNSGLKIVCDSFISTPGAFPAHLVNPQIVNGLQTANVISRLAATKPDAARGAFVFVQVTETSVAALATKIALASNNQQRIGSRDLRANEETQIRLERELKKRHIIYVRKQSEFPAPASPQVIDALRLGQIIVAYHLQLPDKVKTQSNAIFADMYDSVFDPRFLTPIELSRYTCSTDSSKESACL